MKSRPITRWCEHRMAQVPIGVIYYGPPLEVWMMPSWAVDVRAKFLIADLKAAGYTVGPIKQGGTGDRIELTGSFENVLQ